MSRVDFSELSKFFGREIREEEVKQHSIPVADEQKETVRTFRINVTHSEMKLLADELRRKEDIMFTVEDSADHVVLRGQFGDIALPRSTEN